jgi:predicted nucleic acid-binding protein
VAGAGLQAATSAPTSYQAAVIDTTAWISRLITTDGNHAKARVWLNNFMVNGGTLVAPTLFAVEVGTNVSRITGKSRRGRAAVVQIYNLPVMTLVPMDQALVEEATDIGIDFAIKASDAFFVAIAKRLGIPLVTFDKDQLNRPTSIITAIQP